MQHYHYRSFCIHKNVTKTPFWILFSHLNISFRNQFVVVEIRQYFLFSFISFPTRFGTVGFIDNANRHGREDSSNSDDGGDSQSTIFIIGGNEFPSQTANSNLSNSTPAISSATAMNAVSSSGSTTPIQSSNPTMTSSQSANAISSAQLCNSNERLVGELIAAQVMSMLQT